IHLALSRRKLTGRRIGASYVGGVKAVFGGCIDHHQLARFDPFAILVVVKNRAVDPRSNDRRISWSFGSQPGPGCFDSGLRLIFVRAGFDGSYDFAMTLQRNVDRLLKDFYLRRRFDLAHLAYEPRDIDKLVLWKLLTQSFVEAALAADIGTGTCRNDRVD